MSSSALMIQALSMVGTSTSCTPPLEEALQAWVLEEAVEEQEEWVLGLALEEVLVVLAEARMRWPSTNSCLSSCVQGHPPRPNRDTKELWAAQEDPMPWGNTWQT